MNRSILYGILGFIVLLAGILAVSLILVRDEAEMLARIGRFLETGQNERARAEIGEMERRGFHSADSLVEAARLLAGLDAGEAARLLVDLPQRADVSARALRGGTQVALDIGNLPLAQNLLQEAVRLDAASPEAFRLGGVLNFLGGHYREATLFFDSAFTRMTPEAGDRLLHAQALVFSGEADRVLRGKRILGELADEDTPVGAEALLALATLTNIPLLDHEVPALIARMRAHPGFEAILRGKPDALRLIISRFERFDPSFALAMGRLLMRESDPTLRDRVSFAFMALRRDSVEDAEQALAGISGLDRESAEVLALSAYARMLRLETGQGVQAMEVLAAEKPGNPAVMMVTETILFENRPPLAISETEDLINLLLAHPLTTPATRFRCYELLMEIRPLREAEIIRQAIERFRDSEPVALAAWLRGQNRYEAILGLSQNLAEIPPGLLVLRFDSLLSLGRLEQLRAEFDAHRGRLDDANRLLLAADLALREGDPNGWRQWDSAFEHNLSLGRVAGMRRLSMIAARHEDEGRVYRVYRRLFVDRVPLAMEEFELLTQMSLRQAGIEAATEVAEEAARQHPNSGAAINNAAYLNFLRRQQLDHFLPQMEDLVRREPEVRHFRLTLALGKLHAGRPQEALRIAEETALDMSPDGAQGQAIYAAVLAANDRRAAARGFAQNIDRSRLLPEEWNLIANLLN